ncbi:MAG: UDP-4-amino-4,6-dideoxy-N-acetyl-beta-L-altrosamine transaminase [Desulfobacterales bacterium]|nr:UDP-4-amino-4,6-dideoxy-N-acetyl-beta-L-altrosamine transaminase [Desulfobacterales bacterium]
MKSNLQKSVKIKNNTKQFGRIENKSLIPYGRQCIDESDISAVVDVMRSDWLTTGPKVLEFEKAISDYVGAKEAIAVSSGTAALQSAMYAAGIGPGDEVILPPMTFVATANSVIFQGGTPVFVDVDPDTLLIDPVEVEKKITPSTKAIIAMDYAGQACEYDKLQTIARKHGLILIADACHSLGATYKGAKTGSLADLTVFSFHPVKHITTGEGGMIVTDNANFAEKMRIFRNHGITSDYQQRQKKGTWYYEMVDLGYNYRLTDIQCALGLSQLRKLPGWIDRRREIAFNYDKAFSNISVVKPLTVSPNVNHSYHLYVIQLQMDELVASRAAIYSDLRRENIGVNVHYIPVHLHPFYKNRFGYQKGDYPVAEAAYERILSLPLFQSMTDNDINIVIKSIKKIIFNYQTH